MLGDKVFDGTLCSRHVLKPHVTLSGDLITIISLAPQVQNKLDLIGGVAARSSHLVGLSCVSMVGIL